MSSESTRSRAQAAPVFTSSDVHRLYVENAAPLRLALSRLAGPHLDPDDLLQEVFVLALRDRAQLARVDSHRAWLYAVAARVATTRRRSARLRAFLGLAAAQSHAAPESPLRTLEQRDAARRVEQAMGVLPDAKRAVLVLFELQGLSGAEIAAALSIPLKTVWTRLFHARRDFEKELQRLALIEARHSGKSTGALR